MIDETLYKLPYITLLFLQSTLKNQLRIIKLIFDVFAKTYDSNCQRKILRNFLNNLKYE